MRYIKEHFGKRPSEPVVPLKPKSISLVQRIVTYLKASDPAKLPMIAVNVGEEPEEVLRVLNNNPSIFQENGKTDRWYLVK